MNVQREHTTVGLKPRISFLESAGPIKSVRKRAKQPLAGHKCSR